MSNTIEDHAANELNRAIVESLGDMLLVLDLDGNIQKVNRWVLETLKFASTELIGRPAYEIAAGLKARFMAVDEVERVVVLLPEYKEESFLTKDGDTIPVLLSHSLVHSETNEIIAVVWLARDISDLKSTTAQLVQMDKLSAMGELTAGVAHELNQPLNGIKLISQGLLRDLEKKRFKEETLAKEITSIVRQVDKKWLKSSPICVSLHERAMVRLPSALVSMNRFAASLSFLENRLKPTALR